MRSLLHITISLALCLCLESFPCAFFIALGKAGMPIATSPDGANISESEREALIEIEKTLLKEVSNLSAATLTTKPGSLLDALVERQNFFSERANHYWAFYDKTKNAWSTPYAKEQFFLFNGRALMDLKGILNVIEVVGLLNGGDRSIAARSVTFESLAQSIVFKAHRQLVVLEQKGFSKGIYRKGNPSQDYDALFWEKEVSPQEWTTLVDRGKLVSKKMLTARKVKWILVPELQLRSEIADESQIYFHRPSGQLHILVSFKTILDQLQTDQVFIEAVPFRLTVTN